MKKSFLAVALLAALAEGALAAEPTTLTDRVDKLDEVIYGSVQSGPFLDRVGNMDTLVYGKSYTEEGMDERVSDLYRDVVRGRAEDQASLSTRINTLEYYLTDEIKQDGLETRAEEIENTVYGTKKKGSLQLRVADLEKAVYGDTHFELVSVTLPADTIFKISTNEDLSSKTNQVNDIVHFSVEEDVKVDDVLVLPRGAQGSGVVTKVSRPKMFGRSGSLEISFNQVFSIDDEEIPTVLGPEAKEKLKMEAAAVGASVIGALALGPIGLVGGLFVKGKDVEIPAGSVLYIQTQESVTTRGMKQKAGAPSAFKTSKSEGTSDVKVEITSTDTVEKTAVSDKAEAAKKETEAKAQAAATDAAEKVETIKTGTEDAVQEKKAAAEESVKTAKETAQSKVKTETTTDDGVKVAISKDGE